MKNNREKLLEESIKWLGKEASPFDYATDELGCVESLCSIIKHSIARDFPLELATWKLFNLLKKDKRFKLTLDLKPGSIILSPTGSGNGLIRGHTGIIGENGVIMSNNSHTGIWEENYTMDSWIERWRNKGKMPIYVFEPVGEYKDEQLTTVEIQEKINVIRHLINKIMEMIKSLM